MIHDALVSLFGGMGEIIYTVFSILFFLYPLWLPLLLIAVFWELWVKYVRYCFFAQMKYTMLEIRVPKDITKSPLAMELFLHSLYQTGGESTFIDRYWEGRVRPWFSLELVSLGGDVRFLIWTRDNTKQILEAQIYANYPTVEVREVEDYTKGIKYDPDAYKYYATHLIKEKADGFPILTYVDYTLDKNPDVEYEVNPIAAIIETLSAVKPQEQIWFQIVVRPHKGEKRSLFGTKSDWSAAALDEIKRIRLGLKDVKDMTAEDKKLKAPDLPPFSALTRAQQDHIAALERNISKIAFDTGIRVVYFAPKGAYNPQTQNAVRGMTKAFTSNTRNYLKLDFQTTFTDYPWQDFMGIRVRHREKMLFDAYKYRSFFFPPYTFKTNVFSVEELATMYHFPSAAVESPGLTRIPSKKAQPPGNLPI